MTTPENFEQLVEELRKQMNELMMEAVREPMNAAIAQIPTLMQREDWSQENKVKGVQAVRIAVCAPFLNAAVNAAHASGMDLGTFLNYVGSAWEEVRHQHMAHLAADMLNPNKHGEPKE